MIDSRVVDFLSLSNIHSTLLRPKNRSVIFGALPVNQVRLSFPPLTLFPNLSLA